jgi:hypothetical protein
VEMQLAAELPGEVCHAGGGAQISGESTGGESDGPCSSRGEPPKPPTLYTRTAPHHLTPPSMRGQGRPGA